MTLEGQNIWDLSIEKGGSIEAIASIVSQFNDIDTPIPVGTSLIAEGNNVSKWFIDNSENIATLGEEVLGDTVPLPGSTTTPSNDTITWQGQSVWDLITEFGDIEQTPLFISQFNDIDATIPVGTSFSTGNKTRYSRYFITFKTKVATLDAELVEPIIAGFDYTFDFEMN